MNLRMMDLDNALSPQHIKAEHCSMDRATMGKLQSGGESGTAAAPVEVCRLRSRCAWPSVKPIAHDVGRRTIEQEALMTPGCAPVRSFIGQPVQRRGSHQRQSGCYVLGVSCSISSDRCTATPNACCGCQREEREERVNIRVNIRGNRGAWQYLCCHSQRVRVRLEAG
eukprot:315554-Chlamydomonas_euryale.AAC.2